VTERETEGWPEEKGQRGAAAAGELGGESAQSESWSSELARAERDRSENGLFRLGGEDARAKGGKLQRHVAL
jgi:hypothetical protein